MRLLVVESPLKSLIVKKKRNCISLKLSIFLKKYEIIDKSLDSGCTSMATPYKSLLARRPKCLSSDDSEISLFRLLVFIIVFSLQVEKDQNEISRKVKELKGQRDDCHEELGNIKTLTSFIMQAITFWEEVTMLTNAATIKTAQVQKIVDLAAKKNTLKILKSRGTAIKMRSFRESWMEVAEMFGSDTNSLRFIDRNLHFPVNEVKLGEESERHSLLSPCVLVVVLLVAVVSCFLRWLS